MNCPHYEFTLCAYCFRALTPSQQAAIQHLDGSVAAFRAGEGRGVGLAVERPVRARGKR